MTACSFVRPDTCSVKLHKQTACCQTDLDETSTWVIGDPAPKTIVVGIGMDAGQLTLADPKSHGIPVEMPCARTVCTTAEDQIVDQKLGTRDADAQIFHIQPTLTLMRRGT